MNDRILQEYKDFVWGKHSKARTRLSYIAHPKILLEHIGKSVSNITPNDINKYVQYCFERYKQNGNSTRFWSIRQFLKWAKRRKYISINLAKELPKVNPIDAGKTALDEETIGQLISTVENLTPLHRMVFYLELDCSRRPEEIRTLKITDKYVDKLQYKGKTDSRTGKKYCTMSKRMMKAWDDYLKVRPIPATPEDAEYLILNDYGQFKGIHLHTMRPITRIIREICMYAGIEIPHGKQPNNYLIKRTGITHKFRLGLNPKTIMAQAGHTDISTTLKYDRISDKDIKRDMDIFEYQTKNIKIKRQIRDDKYL